METIRAFLEQSEGGKILLTMLISMVPVIELRGAVPVGVAMGLPLLTAFFTSLVGNLFPVPFVILFSRSLFRWLRCHVPVLSKWITRWENNAYRHKEKIEKYRLWGLFLFVAIPLPGTGAWTGSLLAALTDIRLRDAFPAIALGVLTAGCIITALTYGVVQIA